MATDGDIKRPIHPTDSKKRGPPQKRETRKREVGNKLKYNHEKLSQTKSSKFTTYCGQSISNRRASWFKPDWMCSVGCHIPLFSKMDRDWCWFEDNGGSECSGGQEEE